MGKKRFILFLLLVLAAASAVLSACSPEKIKITFDTTGGSYIPPLKLDADAAEVGALATPVKEGYTFEAWYYDSDYERRWDGLEIPADDVTVYAKWEPNVMEVAFVDSENEENNVTITVPYGGDITDYLPDSPVKSGYDGSWDLESLRTTVITEKTTIYAKFVPSRYTINYFVGGKNVCAASGEAGTAVTPPDDPVESGKYFAGWYADDNFTEPCFDLPTSIGGENQTFYAKLIDAEPRNDFFEYEETEDGKITITGLSFKGRARRELLVPSEISGKTVSAVGKITPAGGSYSEARVFDSVNLETLVIPSSVEIIGDFAFAALPALRILKLCDGLKQIGKGAFSGCPRLADVLVPSTVKTLGDYAFAGVVFNPDGTTDDAAAMDMQLDNFVFSTDSDGGCAMESLGEKIFYRTANLQSIVLPRSETYKFDYRTFVGCSVKNFVSPRGEYKYRGEGGAVYETDDDGKTVLLFASGADGGENLIAETAKIAAYAFRDNPNIISLTIPASVTDIGEYAFYGCKNLASVTFSSDENLAAIGKYAFAKSGIKSIILPKSLRTIGEGAFLDAVGLVNAEFSVSETDDKSGQDSGAGLAALPAEIFSGCASLEHFTVPDGVKVIGCKAFFGCADLTEILFSSKGLLEEIGDYAFSDCFEAQIAFWPDNLKKIGDYAFSGNGKKMALSSIPSGEKLTTIGNRAFEGTSARRLEIKSSVTSLGEGVFMNCMSLSKATVRADVTSLPANFFKNCKSLDRVNLSDKIAAVGENAFRNCSALLEITADGLETIGESAFENCTKLKSESVSPLPLSAVGEIGRRAFANCKALKKINVPADLAILPEEAFAGCSDLSEIAYEGNSLIKIEKSCFINCAFKTVKLPADCEIVENPFTGCEDLTEFTTEGTGNSVAGADGVVYETLDDETRAIRLYPTGKHGDFQIAKNVSIIRAYAFCGSIGLEKLTFDGSNDAKRIEIEACAFARSGIKEIVASTRITSIGDGAFSECANLGVIAFSPAVNLGNIGKYAFGGCQNLTKAELPAKLETLEEKAFADCYKLREIVFGESDTPLEIGENAFGRDTALRAIDLPGRLTKLGDYAFDRCYNLSEVNFGASEAPRRIGKYAFRSCHLLYEITLPKIAALGEGETAAFGEGAFYDDGRLTAVNFTGGGEIAIPAKAFFGCANLKKLIFSDSLVVTEIGESAFENAALTNLSEISGLTKIDRRAFANCKKLTDADFSAATTEMEIGEEAFRGCENLASVKFPAGLSFLGKGAFCDCVKLAEILFADESATPLEIGENAFENVAALREVGLPARLTKLGARAFFNCKNLTGVAFYGSPEIGDYAFANTPDLSSVEGNLFLIGENAFENSGIISFVTATESENGNILVKTDAFKNAERLKTVKLNTEGELTVEKGVFAGSAVSELLLRGKLVLKGGFAEKAYKIENFTDVYAPDEIGVGNAVIVDLNGKYEISGGAVVCSAEGENGRTLVQYPSGKIGAVADIPAGVSVISEGAFRGNLFLTALNFPGGPFGADSPFTIEPGAFGENDKNLAAYVSSEEDAAYFIGQRPGIAISAVTSENEKLTFKRLYANKYAVTAYAGKDSELVIKGAYAVGGKVYEITEIAPFAFAGNDTLKKVVLENGIHYIGASAFRDCPCLTEITVPGTVVAIKADAFNGCVKLETARLGSGLKEIGPYAFAGCGLSELNPPDSLENIASYAFKGNKIGSVQFGVRAKLVSVGDGAFSDCINLVSPVLPPSVKELGEGVFSGCKNAVYIKCPATTPPKILPSTFDGLPGSLRILVGDGVLSEYTSDALWRNSRKMIVSEDKIAAENNKYVLEPIGDGNYRLAAYIGAESEFTVESELGAKKITVVGTNCFGSHAEKVTLGEGIEVLEKGAFGAAENLREVILPESLSVIGERAFADLKKLGVVSIPDSGKLKTIGTGAFFGAAALDDISLPESAGTIGPYAFAETKIREFVFPTSGNISLEIGEYAFANNDAVEKMTFVCEVGSLGEGAFSNCVGLKILEFKNNKAPAIKETDKNVFENCHRLTVFVPNGEAVKHYKNAWPNASDKAKLSEIANYLSKDETITVDNEEKTFEQAGFVIAEEEGKGNAFIVGYIGDDEEVIFPAVVVKPPAFAGGGENPVSLRVVQIGRTAPTDKNERNGKVIGDNVTKITVPQSVKTIARDAFRGAKKLETVVLLNEPAAPASLETIGADAFSGCTQLSSVSTFPGSLLKIGSGAFFGCKLLQTVSFEDPEYVIAELTVSERAFASSGLTRINLPKRLKVLGKGEGEEYNEGDGVFENAINLTEAIFAENSVLTAVPSRTFAYTKIENITFPSSVESAGSKIFFGDNCLKSVEMCRETGTEAAPDVFGGVENPFVRVIVPEASFAVYESNKGWGTKTVVPNLISGGFYYKSNSEGTSVAVMGYCGPETVLEIPTLLEGLPVVAVNSYFGNENLKEISFAPHSNVSTLRDRAFAECKNLVKVRLPENLSKFGDYVFYNCVNLKDVVLPENLDGPSEYTFAGCASLEEIRLPERVGKIGAGCFDGCASLRRLKADFAVATSLGTNALRNVPKDCKIIVKADKTVNFREQWKSYADNIVSDETVFGDFVAEKNSDGMTITQYLGFAEKLYVGSAETLYPDTLTFRGFFVTAVAPGALVRGETEIVENPPDGTGGA